MKKFHKIMKSKLNIFLLIFWTSISFAQNYYYYEGEKVPLIVSTDKILIKFKEEIPFDSKKLAIDISPYLKPISKENIIPGNVAIVEVVEGTSESTLQQTINQLHQDKNIICATMFMIYEKDSILQGITDRFVVKLKSPADYSELERLAIETNTTIIEQNQFDKSKYVLSADKNSQGNALKMANYFHEAGIFEYAEPEFYRLLRKYCVNDPFFADQWGLKNTGQYGGVPGCDIDVCSAWEITIGRDVIYVAVIDEGVDLNHPDLIDNLLPGFDATGQGSAGAPQGNDAHGTACAGIIAASGNNGIGISGIAYTCKIMPARVIFRNVSTDTWLADAINWAWQNDADVLSNSWGGGSPSNQITNAINDAVTDGRGELGCSVLFAAGNDNTSVSYPAILNNVIAVGAMSMCTERKRSHSNQNWLDNNCNYPYNTTVADPAGVSCDNEKCWGSNYGVELDVMAPGVKIYTTDISGAAGYETGDYYSDFNGTSSACPHAAGVMALILSINRCLTQNEARQILELSCDKVGLYCYNTTPGHPNGTWNNQMGYGKINAYNAVRYAFSTEINTYTNVSGLDQGANDCNGNLCTWQLAAGGCSGLAAANYLVYWHRVEANVTYPFTSGATILGTSNGFSINSPNIGNYFMGASNVTSTSATLYTYVFETYNIVPQFLGWVPTTPENIRFDYTVLSILDQDLYLQNQTVSTGTEVHNAMNKIEAGRNVTNTIPVGDYIVEGDANVTFHAGNVDILKPGTIIRPESGGSFRMYADPFFTCPQFPVGKNTNNDDGFPPVVKDYEVNKLELKQDHASTENAGISLKSYPNPFTDNTTIEYRISKSEIVTITIQDNCGRQFYMLKNKSVHEAGTYQIKLTGINLPPGIYYCTVQTDNTTETKKLVIVN